jgi:hypothetical protein
MKKKNDARESEDKGKQDKRKKTEKKIKDKLTDGKGLGDELASKTGGIIHLKQNLL